MNQKLAILAVMVVASGLVGSAHAHKSQVVGSYELEVGWKTEPPMVGEENAITVMVMPASGHESSDDASDDHDEAESHDEMTDDSVEMTDDTGSMDDSEHVDDIVVESEDHVEHGVTGLASALEVTVTLNNEKTVLEMAEDESVPGLYLGAYTPMSAGHPTVHVFGTIEDETVEVTFHPETVESETDLSWMSPLQQQMGGIAPNEVLCSEGLTLISKKSDGSAACVSESTATLLIARGWATSF